MPIGFEGAGIVIITGSSDAAKALMGRKVAMFGGGMYAQYRCLKIADCLPLPDGTTPAEGASCFVNPLTALGMTETMRTEGHTALVHTAAASNLGPLSAKLLVGTTKNVALTLFAAPKSPVAPVPGRIQGLVTEVTKTTITLTDQPPARLPLPSPLSPRLRPLFSGGT